MQQTIEKLMCFLSPTPIDTFPTFASIGMLWVGSDEVCWRCEKKSRIKMANKKKGKAKLGIKGILLAGS